MSELGSVFFPVGVFIALAGVVLVTNSPFMKEILDPVEFLQKNRRLVGGAMVVLGFALMALSLGA
ncbi:MAG: hypothetical protein NTV61_02685 [Candidatus Bathyarchaeota archaeon]|nr:hypothetical protein [Candidatus Bathyarchaeota archaeon]